MNKNSFETAAHAKCILAGEHAVMRHSPAILAPIHDLLIKLHYEDSDQLVNVQCHAPYEDVFLLFFWGTIKNGLQIVNKNIHDVHGKFVLENNIQMGAGIGFSSALCVVIARWFVWKNWIKESKLFDFAQHLENSYHGQNSGVDIAGAISDEMIHFEKTGHVCKKISPHWLPKLYISYSGYIKSTSEAVDKVKSLRQKGGALAKLIDEEMSKSVQLIEEGLKLNQDKGLQMLASGIDKANHCFDEWQLITPELNKHMMDVHDLGAIAVKPTGAGIGGYILSLWDKTPPKNAIELIPLFKT